MMVREAKAWAAILPCFFRGWVVLFIIIQGLLKIRILPPPPQHTLRVLQGVTTTKGGFPKGGSFVRVNNELPEVMNRNDPWLSLG